MTYQYEASFHAIPEGYPQPKDTKELVESIDETNQVRHRVPMPTLPDGEQFGMALLIEHFGE